MTIKFDQEEYQKYFEEIFYNEEMMETDDDDELEDLEEEFNPSNNGSFDEKNDITDSNKKDDL